MKVMGSTRLSGIRSHVTSTYFVWEDTLKYMNVITVFALTKILEPADRHVCELLLSLYSNFEAIICIKTKWKLLISIPWR